MDFPFERPVLFIENHFSSSPKGHTGDFKGANMLGLEPKCQFSYLQLQCSVISKIQKRYENDFQIESKGTSVAFGHDATQMQYRIEESVFSTKKKEVRWQNICHCNTIVYPLL